MNDVICYDSAGQVLEELCQWDVNVTIQVGDAITSPLPNFHFCQHGRDYAYVVPSELKGDKLSAKVPNILLQSHYPLHVFLYYGSNPDEQRSKHQFSIEIVPREMPMEYTYVENIGYEDWVHMTEEAKAIIDASENLDARIKEAQEILDQMDEDVQQAQTAEQSASQHEQGAKKALTDTQAVLEEAKKKATEAAGGATAAEGSATNAKADADRAAAEAAAALKSQTAAATSQEAAKKSEDAAAQHLADALAAKQGAEAARDDAKKAQTGAEEALEQATQKADDAASYADIAKQYSGNPAIPKNGTWWVWNAEAGEYQDTGKRAVLKPDVTYKSVAEMKADTSQEENTLAIISTEVNVEENAQLYIWDGSEWQFLADLSGFQGVSITSIELVSGDHSPGTLDRYRITLDNETTFEYEVYNGKNGEGMGDMLESVYDPRGIKKDIYQYVDDKAPNITVSDDGEGNVTVSF